MTEYERVRTEAVRITKNILDLPSDEYTLVQCADMIVGRILPLVEIKSDDQSLPDDPYDYTSECRESTAYSEGQHAMKEAGFVKVVKEEQ